MKRCSPIMQGTYPLEASTIGAEATGHGLSPFPLCIELHAYHPEHDPGDSVSALRRSRE